MGTKRVIRCSTSNHYLLADAFEDFQMANRAKNLSKATVRGYQEAYNRFAALGMQALQCSEVSLKTINAFVSALMDDGIKSASINHYLRCIRCFLYWCMNEGHVKKFKVPLQKEQESVKVTYTDSQIRDLIREPSKQASFVEWRTWAMTCWFLATGNRAETVCSIRLADLLFHDNEIHINKTKTNKALILPMSIELKRVLHKYIHQFRSDSSDEEYLFCNVGNQKLTVNALKCSIRSYNLNRGVGITGIHAFRHTFADRVH